MDDRIVSRLIQIGTVMAVQGTKARVRHEDTGIISDFLPVLQRTGEVVSVETGYGPDSHKHDASVTSWVPQVNDRVLCIYLPIENSDGFIIGRI